MFGIELIKDDNDKNKVKDLLMKTVGIIAIVGYITYQMWSKNQKEQGKDSTVTTFFLGEKRDQFQKRFLVGMASGAVFGFIDNAGLFQGMDNLDPLLNIYAPRENYVDGPEGDKMHNNIIAGMGNTYSDAVGSFLSVFIGRMIAMQYKIDETPMIAESIGLIIGCVAGFKAFEKRKPAVESSPNEPSQVPVDSGDSNLETKYRFVN